MAPGTATGAARSVMGPMFISRPWSQSSAQGRWNARLSWQTRASRPCPWCFVARGDHGPRPFCLMR